MKTLIFIPIFTLAIRYFARGQSTGNSQIPSVEGRDLNSMPKTVYVEVLCIIDNATYELHGSDDKAVHDYFLSFWKTVDKYFKLLNNPYVRISLSQILALQDIPSLSNFHPRESQLISIGKYIYAKKNELPHHDVAVFFTPSPIIVYKDEGIHEVAGLTHQSKACDIDDRKKIVKSVAIVRDDEKAFKGIRKTIALIGQLLGAVEEDSTRAESFESSDGFIMSSNNNFSSPFKFDWSDRSKNSIRHFLTNNSSTCLFNKPKQNMNLDTHWLPGQALSLSQYCEILTGQSGTCWERGVSPCTKMLCRNKFNECLPKNWGPALEGSWCRDEMRCSYGQCVAFESSTNENSL